MKPPRTHLTILLVLFALAATFAAAISASSLTGGSRLTVVPPAYYAGSERGDAMTGTSANDVLLGRGGNDTLNGRGGNDVLQGGIGNDRFFARDSARDTVFGGPGFDEAWVDRVDVVRNVERVHRP